MKFGWKTPQMSTLIFLFVFFTVMESNDVCSASELVFVWSYFTLSMSSWPIVLLFFAHPALTSSCPLFTDRSTCLYISSMSPVSKSSHKGITLHSVCPSGWMESPSTNMDGYHIHHLVICAGFGLGLRSGLERLQLTSPIHSVRVSDGPQPLTAEEPQRPE